MTARRKKSPPLLTGPALAERLGCSARQIRYHKANGMPHEVRPAKKGQRRKVTMYDPENVREWLLMQDPRTVARAAAREAPPATAPAASRPAAEALAREPGAAESLPLHRQAARDISAVYRRLQLAELAGFEQYREALSDKAGPATIKVLQANWQESAKRLIEVAAMVPEAERSAKRLVERSEIQKSHALIGSVTSRMLQTLPAKITNKARPLLADQAAGPELSAIVEAEVAEVQLELTDRLKREAP